MSPAAVPLLLVVAGAIVAGLVVHLMHQGAPSAPPPPASPGAASAAPSPVLFPDRPAASAAFQMALDATETAARKAAADAALKILAPQLASEPAKL